MFSGSYCPDDVTFLLKVIDIPPTGIVEKERLIQSGKLHYSEMISYESPPSTRYLELFHDVCIRNNARFARDLVTLARHIADTTTGEITLVSLARAGTPVGVLLNRIIKQYLHRDVCHYSISIIRDRSIDELALLHILQADGHSPESIIFVDGWTGKGVIAAELAKAVESLNQRWGVNLCPQLYVVADISGTAGVAATSDDYLIPSSILNSVVSGLISRSILNTDYIGPDDFHGCLYYKEFENCDLSVSFVESVMREVEKLQAHSWTDSYQIVTQQDRSDLHKHSLSFIEQIRQQYAIKSIHHIKPGIGEATRVLLRRVPDRILLHDVTSSDVAHIIQLASEKSVPCEEVTSLPYCAAAIIKEMD